MKHRKYYKSLSKWPLFDIPGNNIDGNIPSTFVKDWQHFQNILKEPFFSGHNGKLIYRGQRRFDWGLVPTIARYNDAGIFTDQDAKIQIENYRLSIRGRLIDSTMQGQDDELWALGP
jgi:hypothetical protein